MTVRDIGSLLVTLTFLNRKVSVSQGVLDSSRKDLIGCYVVVIKRMRVSFLTVLSRTITIKNRRLEKAIIGNQISCFETTGIVDYLVVTLLLFFLTVEVGLKAFSIFVTTRSTMFSFPSMTENPFSFISCEGIGKVSRTINRERPAIFRSIGFS